MSHDKKIALNESFVDLLTNYYNDNNAAMKEKELFAFKKDQRKYCPLPLTGVAAYVTVYVLDN